MIKSILWGVVTSFVGTTGFAVLFGANRKRYISCGLVGAAGWLVYELLYNTGLCGPGAAILAATIVVAFLSRGLAVRFKIPTTVFLTCGLFPLVPGAGLFWTVYYFLCQMPSYASEYGFLALKSAGAIVLGIVIVYQIPNKVFALIFHKKE